MGSAIFFGLTCPANSEGLINGAPVLSSRNDDRHPERRLAGGVSLINAFILATCLSAINSSIFIGSRTLLFMAQDRKAPKVLGYTNKRGVPVYAILLTNAVGALSMMNLSTGASKAYAYIVNCLVVSTFLVWGAISFTHIRFRKAWSVQGRSPSDLPFQSWLYPGTPTSVSPQIASSPSYRGGVPFLIQRGRFRRRIHLLPLFPSSTSSTSSSTRLKYGIGNCRPR